MRQYRVFYKRGNAPKYGVLQPGVHLNLYTRPEIVAAVELLRTTPIYEGLAIRVEDEMFNIMVFDQPAEAPNAFKFDEPAREVPTNSFVITRDGDGTRMDPPAEPVL